MSRWSPELHREALRIHRRFNEEVIERFNVCPYAKGARQTSTSEIFVLPIERADVGAIIAIIEQLEGQPEIEVAQVVCPLVGLDAATFSEFASEVGRTNAARFSQARPHFVHAAFHPHLAYSEATAQRMVPFFRRSPDPMIQLVRLAVLDSIHKNHPRGTMFFDGPPEQMLELLMRKRPESVTERITRENHEAARAGMKGEIEAMMASICDDRDETYRRVLGSWAGHPRGR